MPEFNEIHQQMIQEDKSAIEPTKISKIVEILIEHFNKKSDKETRVMIFTSLRDSVIDIVSWLKKYKNKGFRAYVMYLKYIFYFEY